MTAAPSYAAAYPTTGHSFADLRGMSNSASATASEPLNIAKSDYGAFERLLGDIQGAFSTEDLSTLRTMVTPEMLSYFSEQLADNASRGLANRVTEVRLLQGDLAEAWREGRTDYATVAMKYALKDSMVERASGRTVEGGDRTEVTELWTFMRARGGNWMLQPSSRRDARYNSSARRGARRATICLLLGQAPQLRKVNATQSLVSNDHGRSRYLAKPRLNCRPLLALLSWD